MNPYTELDVPVNASLEAIKQRYRTLAQIHHPDKGGDEELFKRIKLAYEILSDPIRRKQYDTTGDASKTNIRDEAVANIVEILLKNVYSFNNEQDDLINMIEYDIRDLINLINADIFRVNADVQKLEKVLNRIRKKVEGENFLNSIITNQISLKKVDLANFQKRIIVCNLMIEIIKDYEYGLQSLVFEVLQTE
jgi:curved DNA-binding protein CbpA